MHFQRRCINQMPWPGKFLLKMMFSYYMANILAKETFNTFPELLHPVNIPLIHSPGSVRRIRRPRLESFYFLFDFKVYRHISNKVFNDRERLHRLNGNGFILGQITHAGHTHQLWAAVDFSGARATLSGFTIPSYSQVVSTFRLDLVDRV